MKYSAFVVTTIALAMLAFSCGGDSESESPPDEQVRVDEFPLLRGPLSPLL